VADRSLIPSITDRLRRLRGRQISLAARVTLSKLPFAALQRPPFTLRFWDGSVLTGESERPVVVLRRPQALAYLMRAPNQIGLARAWVTGALEVEGELERVIAVRNRFAAVKLSPADRLRLLGAAARTAPAVLLARAPVPAIEARPKGKRHSLARDRQAVSHHYNVSNEFYRLLLGSSMTYSCAYFNDPEDSLEEAQERKHELICRKLRLVPGERLLDIGCGWGTLLVHAARSHGVRGVGVTLSAPQGELARERVREAGVSDLVEIRQADYREVRDGPFDKVVSVGMYEHVGRAELDRYAATVASLLRPGGLFLNHGIVRLSSEPPRSDTSINRYIFPDGELHPVTGILGSMSRAGLEVRDVESLREHYPLTLRRWLANLEANRSEAIALVGEEREISVYQALAARMGAEHPLPLSRADLLGAPLQVR
jgi:cyclopropane-fatty-acyl-phospholipid synthase